VTDGCTRSPVEEQGDGQIGLPSIGTRDGYRLAITDRGSPVAVGPRTSCRPQLSLVYLLLLLLLLLLLRLDSRRVCALHRVAAFECQSSRLPFWASTPHKRELRMKDHRFNRPSDQQGQL
jgi:hypothetical protein